LEETKHTSTKVPPAPPKWWNAHGNEMTAGKVGPLDGVPAELFISSGVIAHIKINQVQRRPKWTVDWLLHHFGGLDIPHSGGRIEADTRELLQMLGSDDREQDAGSLWLIERYGGTVALQGKFIRWGRYLNISGPGTGRNGDANISVYVTDEIEQAVRTLIERRRTV